MATNAVATSQVRRELAMMLGCKLSWGTVAGSGIGGGGGGPVLPLEDMVAVWLANCSGDIKGVVVGVLKDNRGTM